MTEWVMARAPSGIVLLYRIHNYFCGDILHITAGSTRLLMRGDVNKIGIVIPDTCWQNIVKVSRNDLKLTMPRETYILGMPYRHMPKWNGSSVEVFFEDEADFVQAKLGE